MLIRPLTTADAEAYVALRAESLIREPVAFGASPEDDVAASLDFVRARLAEPNRAIFGAFDPALIGTVGIHRNATTKGAHKTHIWGMYVQAGHRGSGVGTQLMRAAIAFARALPGVRQVQLCVSSPAAAVLYQRLGFRTWGIEPLAMIVDGTPVDEQHMVLHLDAEVPIAEGASKSDSPGT